MTELARPRPLDADAFREPNRDFGILPFWFLNGELDPQEMLYQLREFRDKGMPGIILHGRYGLETDYIGETYLDRIHFAVEEAEKLGFTPKEVRSIIADQVSAWEAERKTKSD